MDTHRDAHRDTAGETPRSSARHGSDHIGGDSRDLNFFQADGGLRDLLSLYLSADEQVHFWPHFDRLGALAGGDLDRFHHAAHGHRDSDTPDVSPATARQPQVCADQRDGDEESHPGPGGRGAKYAGEPTRLIEQVVEQRGVLEGRETQTSGWTPAARRSVRGLRWQDLP